MTAVFLKTMKRTVGYFSAMLIVVTTTLVYEIAPARDAANAADQANPPASIRSSLMRGLWAGNIDFFADYPVVDGMPAYYNPSVEPRNLPVFTPRFAAMYRDIREKQQKGIDAFDPGIGCAPLGVPAVLSGFEFEFIFSPGRTTILYETLAGVRRIFTDGRAIPIQGEPDPAYYGYSVGHWEGDTLVVHTNNLRGDTAADILMPHSDKLQLEERYRLVGKDELELSLTMTDPEAFIKPWTVIKHYKRITGMELEENACSNDRHVIENGHTYLLGPDGKPLKPKN